jgi:thiol-disulfide isomerase/thioredoxin
MTENLASTNRLRNIIIAVVAIVLSLSIFLGLQTKSNSTSLENQANNSTPLEVAITNNKPTLIEFYASWCTSCQAMAKDLGELKQEYGNKINFVMLNVDNNKWLPEILRYRVDGIPHFIFLNQVGEAIAETIGEQPKNILSADLQALITNEPLPYIYSQGQVSTFSASLTNSPTDPRSHGSQVK